MASASKLKNKGSPILKAIAANNEGNDELRKVSGFDDQESKK